MSLLPTQPRWPHLHLLHPIQKVLHKVHVGLSLRHVGVQQRRLNQGLEDLRVFQMLEGHGLHAAAAAAAVAPHGLRLQPGGQGGAEAGGGEGGPCSGGSARAEGRAQGRVRVLGEVEAVADARDHPLRLLGGQRAALVVHGRALGPQGEQVVP